MPTKALIIGILAAAALPMAAQAQPYDPGCVRSNEQNTVAGTALGAIGGALLGGAVAGRHDRGAGVVVGGVGGALAGNAIARSNNHPCPPGYDYAPGPAAYDRDGGDRHSIHERIDFLQGRINEASDDHRISPRDFDQANRELSFIRSEEDRLRDQDGGDLRAEDRDYLQGRLDNLNQRLRWYEQNG
jgi:hypothetical protein